MPETRKRKAPRLGICLLLAALLAALALAGAAEPAAAGGKLKIGVAKERIATAAYLTNGYKTHAYGARKCRRRSRSKVSCLAYVKKPGKTCTDRMTAVKRGGKVRVKGSAKPSKWRCR